MTVLFLNISEEVSRMMANEARGLVARRQFIYLDMGITKMIDSVHEQALS